MPVIRALSPFAILLDRHLRRSGKSYAHVAHGALVDPSYISRLATGDRQPPRRRVVERLAHSLGLDGAETERFLVAAGYAPAWASQLALTTSFRRPTRAVGEGA